MSLEEVFAVLGRKCAKRPLLVLTSYLLFFIIGGIGWDFASLTNTEQNDHMWALGTGPTHLEQASFKFLHKRIPWMAGATLAFSVDKKVFGDQVISRGHFDELQEMYKSFVNASAYPWSDREIRVRLYDIATRALGAVPDTHTFDGGFPVFPAVHPNHLVCLQEYSETMDTCAFLPPDVPCAMGYNALEPFMYLLFPLSLVAGPTFSARPSGRAVPSSALLQLVSSGCPWFTRLANWVPWLWAGGTEPVIGEILAGSPIAGIKAYLWILIMDGARRIQFRVSLSQPKIAALSMHDLTYARRHHAAVYANAFVNPSRSTSEFILLATLAPDLFVDLIDTGRQMEWGLLIGGGVAMVCFVELSFSDFKNRMRSHAACATFAFTCVGMSMFCSWGYYSFMGFYTNGACAAVIPFLGMGLGVNDMFVIMIGFCSLGPPRLVSESYEEILGEVLGHAGEGVTLTTVCNFACFCCGVMVPVLGIQQFCIHASLTALGNWIVVMTLFLCRIREEARRLKAGQVDIGVYSCVCCCQMSIPANPDVDPWGTWSINFIGSIWGPFVLKPPVWVVSFILTAVLLVLAAPLIGAQGNGWILSQLAPRDLPNIYNAFKALSFLFSIWENYLGYSCINVPDVQIDVLTFNLGGIVGASSYNYPNLSPDFLSFFALYMLLGGVALDVDLGNSPFLHGLFGVPGLTPADQFYDLWAAWTLWPAEPLDALNPANQGYTNADIIFAFEFAYDDKGHHMYPLDKWYSLDIGDNARMEECLVNIRDVQFSVVVDGQEIPSMFARPVAESNFMWYWGVGPYVPSLLINTLSIITAIIFMLSVLILRSLAAASIGTILDLIIVVEVWTLTALWTLMNTLMMTYLFLSFGISVEFTAHTIAYFNLARGDALQRLRIALKATLPAVLLGAISTLLAVGPLFLGSTEFGIICTGSTMYVLQALGFVNASVVLPSLLGLLAFILGILGFGMQRVSSKRNSGAQEPTTAAPEASKQEEDYNVEVGAVEVSPVRAVTTRGHFK